MGDLGSFASASMYNADLRAFYEKWADDLLDSQSVEGAFPDTVPRTVHTGEGNGGWADAGIQIPFEVYRRYGDQAYLEKLYPAMCRYMDYLYARSDFDKQTGLIGPGNIYGDWLGGQDTDSDLLCAMWYGADAKAMSQIAQILGKKEDAKAYEQLLSQIIDFLEERYFSEKKQIGFTQTELLFLLHYELYETGKSLGEDPRGYLSGLLAEDVTKNGCRVMTGFAGTPLLLSVLCDVGREDLAYQVLVGEENPSWMYSVEQGATTIWERYDSYTKEKGFQDAAMNSFDHFNEGSVAAWMYEYMAGIKVDHSDPMPVSICPHLPPVALFQENAAGEKCPQKVSGCYHSVYGIIQVDWQLEREQGSEKAIFDLQIPDNAKARVSLPIEGFEMQVLGPGTYHFEGVPVSE